LKRAACTHERGMMAAFPRLRRRGPIEAWKARVQSSIALRFPRLRRRGPIEAA